MSEKIIELKTKTIFVSGNFNTLHPGRVRFLSFARACGDRLVVGLFVDGSEGATRPFELRRDALLSLGFIDEVLPLSMGSLISTIEQIKPFGVVKGKEHEGRFNPERTALELTGGHLIFAGGVANQVLLPSERTTHVKRLQELQAHDFDYLARHETSLEKMRELIPKFAQQRGLIVGDLIIDEYIDCRVLGLSQEDPTIVVNPISSKRFIGGAGIVAGHLKGLGAQVQFLGVVGDDKLSYDAEDELLKLGVECSFVRDPSRPTTLKRRYRANNKTLLRVSDLRDHDADMEFTNKVYSNFQRLLPNLGFVIFSDFNYGALPQNLVHLISQECLINGIPWMADSQSSSQVGDISRFEGARLITATEREARLAINDFKGGLEHVINSLAKKSKAKSTIVKLGADGMLVLDYETTAHTETLPSLNQNPLDVAGAGDALLATAAVTLSSGGTTWEASYLGNLAAAIQISRVGNEPIRSAELLLNL